MPGRVRQVLQQWLWAPVGKRWYGDSPQLHCEFKVEFFLFIWWNSPADLIPAEKPFSFGKSIPRLHVSTDRYFVENGVFHIMNVSHSDQGVYRCVAKTPADQDVASALLMVLGELTCERCFCFGGQKFRAPWFYINAQQIREGHKMSGSQSRAWRCRPWLY